MTPDIHWLGLVVIEVGLEILTVQKYFAPAESRTTVSDAFPSHSTNGVVPAHT